jgi:hypothetical protein
MTVSDRCDARFKETNTISKARKIPRTRLLAHTHTLTFVRFFLDILKRATAGRTELTPIESAVNGLTVHSNGADEISAFVRVVRSFLALDPTKRPRAAEALLDPAFKDIL